MSSDPNYLKGEISQNRNNYFQFLLRKFSAQTSLIIRFGFFLQTHVGCMCFILNFRNKNTLHEFLNLFEYLIRYLTSERSSWTREGKFYIYKQPYFIMWLY